MAVAALLDVENAAEDNKAATAILGIAQ